MGKGGKILTNASEKELEREVGIKNEVDQKGFGGISSKLCGEMVKKAVEDTLKIESENYRDTLS